MPVIYMVHPTHGAKVAISDAEAILDAMDGWERYNIHTSSVMTDDDEDDASPPVGNRIQRRGRKRNVVQDVLE